MKHKKIMSMLFYFKIKTTLIITIMIAAFFMETG